MFKKILVAIDGSQPSQNAVKAACDLAKHYKAELHLVHTPRVETVAYAMGASAVVLTPPQADLDAAGQKVLAEASEVAATAGAKPTSQKLLSGDPAHAVIEAATDLGVDLIVAGRRGLGSLSSLFLGSTSQHIAHHARCAVLTIK